MDRTLLGVFAALWLVCVALTAHQALSGGIQWPSVLVVGAGVPDGYPVVTGYWPGTDPAQVDIRAGDEVIGAGRFDLAGASAVRFFADLLEARSGQPTVAVRYRRMGRDGEVNLQLTPFPVPWWVFLLLPTTFAVLAGVVALRGPAVGEARAVLQAYVVISFFFLPWQGGWRVQTYAYLYTALLAGLLVLPLSVRSFLLFPDEVAPRRRWIRAAPWVFSVLPLFMGSWWFGTPLPHTVGYRGAMLVSAAFVITMLSISVLAYRRGSPVARRKMRWRLYGSYVGMVPVLIAVGVAAVYPDQRQVMPSIFLSCIALVAVPIALTIAIVRYNVLDIDHLISATASYSLLTTAGVAAALTLVPRAAEALSVAVGIQETVGQVTLSCLIAALLMPIHRRLRPQIDRLFFAHRYAVEQGMERLLADLDAGGEPEALLRFAASRLEDLLQPQSLALYGGRGDAYEALFWRGDLAVPTLDAAGPLVAALKERSRPVCADLGAQPWMESARDPFEQAALERLRATVIVPMRSGTDLVAFLSLGAKRSKDVYTGTDLSWLTAVAEKISGALLRRDYSQRIERERAMRENLRRYVPEAIAGQIDRGAELTTSEREVCVLFVDLRGYTAYSEGRTPEEIFSTVNCYTELASEIILRHGGTVVEFAGDGMMAVFGAPQELPAKERAAVEAGYELVRAIPSLAAGGAKPMAVGVGIATGPAFAGNVHSSDRLIWTVIGNTTNLAARLQALTKELKVDLAIDTATWKAAGAAAAAFRCRPAVAIRGRTAPENVYILDLESAL